MLDTHDSHFKIPQIQQNQQIECKFEYRIVFEPKIWKSLIDFQNSVEFKFQVFF